MGEPEIVLDAEARAIVAAQQAVYAANDAAASARLARKAEEAGLMYAVAAVVACYLTYRMIDRLIEAVSEKGN